MDILQPTAAGNDPSWIPTAASAMWMATATESGGGHKPGKEPLQNWSSLIGIVTAIVGNMLIAMALNVQRYAHTRLHKERVSIRRRARAATKRSRADRTGGSYGTVRRNGNGNTNGDGNGATISDEDGTPHHTPFESSETDPLAASFQSSEGTEDDAEEAERQAKAASSYLKSPYWWLGQILITLGEMGNFLAYGFAPASIVSPLGVVALVSNCLIAPLMFHERFRQRDFWGVVIAVAGVVTVVLSANQEENKLNPHDVWGAITTMEFEIYLGVTVFLIIALMIASPKYGKQTILIDLGLVGLFGGYTALATKGVSSMLSSTLWRAFTTPVTYVLMFILLGTAIMQIRYVNKALQRFDSTQVIPIQFVMFTLCVILGSAILYRDFERTTAEQAGKFVGGCLLTFFGVFLITSGRGHSHDDEDALSEAEGVEETIGLAHHESNHPSRAPSVSRSRRSSRHSRAGYPEPARPHSPEEEDDTPSFRYTGPGTTPSSLGPESASLLGNPWAQGQTGTTPPGRGLRTLSADTFMRGSAVITPNRSNPASPMRDGQLPPGYTYPEQGGPITPQPRASTYGAPGQQHGHHRSGSTFISPSPLSSTVTTVMKDGFLRDKRALPSKSSMRHLRSRIRASLFFNDNEDDSDNNAASGSVGGPTGVPASEDNLTRVASHGGEQHQYQPYEDEVAAAVEEGRMRSRSLSDTIGDFFKSKKKKQRKGENIHADIEQGHETDTPPGPSS